MFLAMFYKIYVIIIIILFIYAYSMIHKINYYEYNSSGSGVISNSKRNEMII